MPYGNRSAPCQGGRPAVSTSTSSRRRPCRKTHRLIDSAGVRYLKASASHESQASEQHCETATHNSLRREPYGRPKRLMWDSFIPPFPEAHDSHQQTTDSPTPTESQHSMCERGSFARLSQHCVRQLFVHRSIHRQRYVVEGLFSSPSSVINSRLVLSQRRLHPCRPLGCNKTATYSRLWIY